MTGRRTYMFAGGGSGGHLFPGIAVAEELGRRDPECRIVFAGSERGIERVVLAETNYSQVALPVSSSGTLLTRPLRFAEGFTRSLHESFKLLDRFRPKAVIGLGGFASLPLGLAAWQRGVPLILLEQNVVPGRATSLLSRFAMRVCVSFEETVAHLPKSAAVTVTGNPLRSKVRDCVNRGMLSQVRQELTLLVLGGSQGAKGVNEMVTGALQQVGCGRHWRYASGTLDRRRDSSLGVPRSWKIVHQTGDRDEVAVRAAYRSAGIEAEVSSYFNDLPHRYADADLVVTRGGGTTLAELAAFGCPAIVVPYPGSIRDHQQRNAEHFARAGGVEIVAEGLEGESRLISTLERLINDPAQRSAMGVAMRRIGKLNATSQVVDLLISGNMPVKRAA